MRSQLKLQALLATALLVGGLSGSCSNSSDFSIAPGDSQQASSSTTEIADQVSAVSLMMETDTVTLKTPLGDLRAGQIVVDVQDNDFPASSFQINGATFIPARLTPADVTRYRSETLQDAIISVQGVNSFDIPGIDHTCVIIRNLQRIEISRSTACDMGPTPTPSPGPTPSPTPTPSPGPGGEDVIPGPQPAVCPAPTINTASFLNQISISPVSQFESQSPFEFTVTLIRNPFGGVMNTATVRVDVFTEDDTAQSPADYEGFPEFGDARPYIEFGPNDDFIFDGDRMVQTKTVEVEVVDDGTIEGDERFQVNLSNPCNTTIITPSGTGTILNDTVAFSYPNQFFTEGFFGSSNFPSVLGATRPFTFTIEPEATLNTLGLTFNENTGVLSGSPIIPTPNTDFNQVFTVTLTDSNGLGATDTFTLNVDNNPPAITVESPQEFTVGDGVTIQPEVTGGDPPFSFAITNGTLPANLILDPFTGTISGTALGSGTVTITVTDSDGDTDDAILTINVVAPAP